MDNDAFTYLKETMSADLVNYIMQNYNISVEEALNVLYESETYSKLCEPSTGLYFQSPLYVYSYLRNELNTGRFA